MDDEQYIESGLSVGTTKIANKYEIFTEEEVDAINNKIPELNERVGVIEDEIDEINSSLDNKANQSDLEVEKNRIDNIIKNEGTSINDLELQDIRIDVNGKVFDTAGEATRDQIKKLNGFAKLDETKKILNTPFMSDYGVLIVGNNNKVTTGFSTRSANTGYIELTPEIYNITIEGENFGVNDGMATFAFYDVNKNYISGTNTADNTLIPEGAIYVAVGNYNPNSNHTGLKVTFHRYKALIPIENNQKAISEITSVNHNNIHPTMTSGQWLEEGVVIKNDNVDLSTSDFIEIPSKSVSLQCNIGVFSRASVIAFYDKTKKYISGITDVKTESIPTNAYYIRLSNYTLSPEKVPHSEVNYTFKTVKRLVDIENKIEFINKEIEKFISSNWSAKKWCVVGDSITEDNFRAEKHYWSYINEITGITIINKGISGTGYKQYLPFYERIEDDTFPTDCNVITMKGGINDVVGWDNELPIGEVTDTDNTTICGCVNLAINALEKKYPTYLPLGIISPLPADVDLKVFPNCRFPKQYPSITDCRLEEFTEKLRKICLLRGYPFLDLFHTSGLRPWDLTCKNELFKPKEGYGEADGLHPNSKGHEKIYPKIFEFIKTIII